MAYLSRITLWVSGQILYASDLNNEFTNIYNNIMVSPGGDTQGDLLYRGPTIWKRLPAGVSGQFLRTLGGLQNPKWDNLNLQADFSAVVHAWLQGLSADDHPQYLNLNKVSQTLLQNLAVGAGVTIAGRNIAADGIELDDLWNSGNGVPTAYIATSAVTRGVEFYNTGTIDLSNTTETEIGTITTVTNLTTDVVWLWASAEISQAGGVGAGGKGTGSWVPVEFRIRRDSTSGTQIAYGYQVGLGIVNGDYTPIILIGSDTPGGSAGNHVYKLTAQATVAGPYTPDPFITHRILMGIAHSK